MELLQDRRALHRIPELGRDLPKTVQYLKSRLEKLRCRVFAPIDGALCAYFDFGGEKTIAFRADMDALPVEEKTGLPFSSEHPGRMHACGHDGHMAILLELARRLDRQRTDANVLLIFQPDEEGSGGAKALCKTGILEAHSVNALFGLHLWPGLEAGKLHSRKGEMMSRSSEVTLTVTGKAAHIGNASQGKDALAACAAFYAQAAAMEKAMDPAIIRLLKFGRMEAGTVRNVIADTARLEGSLRTFDDAVFDAMKNALQEIGAEVQRDTGCTLTLQISQGYPAVYNPAAVADKVEKLADIRVLEQPTIITEDFSWYQRHVPGMFFFLGVGETPPLHAQTFTFDEQILCTGADFFETLARSYR